MTSKGHTLEPQSPAIDARREQSVIVAAFSGIEIGNATMRRPGFDEQVVLRFRVSFDQMPG